jgi:hypothetical protein
MRTGLADFAGMAGPSRQSERLHGRRHRIREEHRIDPFHDVAGDFEKVPLVFEPDQSPACAIVHADLRWQGPAF